MKKDSLVKRTHNIETYTIPQLQFWTSCLNNRISAYVGGVGAGKTFAGCVQMLNAKEGSTILAISPTYSQMRDSSLKLFMEIYGESGLIESHNSTNMETRVAGNRTILWRSADNPSRLRGSNCNFAWLDEAAYMTEELFHVVLGRLRRAPGNMFITTTPRGKNWLYRKIQDGMIHMTKASTASNKFNPSSYLEAMKMAYTGSFAAQELEGEFVDTDGSLMAASKWVKPWEGELPKMVLCRAFDSAATRHGGDWNASVKMGLIVGTNKVVILDVTRIKLDAASVDPDMLTHAELDGKKCNIVLELEPGSAGKRLINHCLQLLAGYPVNWYANSSNKITRAVPFARAAAAGEVFYLPDKPWAKAYFEELDQFTGTDADEHDDQVDATSLAYNHLTGRMRKVIAV
jgi:predicted phage terminase large subunit-like protein